MLTTWMNTRDVWEIVPTPGAISSRSTQCGMGRPFSSNHLEPSIPIHIEDIILGHMGSRGTAPEFADTSFVFDRGSLSVPRYNGSR